MNTTFSCSCGTTFMRRPELEGKRVKCPSCGRVFEVPIAASLADGPSDVPPLSPLSAATSATKAPLATLGPAAAPPSSPPWVWIAGGVVAVVGLLLIGLVALSLSRTTTASQNGSTSTTSTVTGSSGRAASTAKPAAPGLSPPPPPAAAASGAVPPPPVWAVTADPSPRAVEWPESTDLSIPLTVASRTLVYPATPGPFVVTGLGSSGGQKAAVWDLLAKTQTGKLTEAVEKVTAPFAVSPDGSLLAAVPSSGTKAPTVRLWSFQTGKFARDIVCDEPLVHVKAFEFAGPNRLVTHSSGSSGKRFVHRLRVWEVESGRQVHDIPLTDFFQRSHWAISPGGRFVAVYGPQKTIQFFDLLAGVPAGSVALESVLSQSPGPFHGIEFSPDGKQLAVVLGSTNTLLVFLDLATGEIAEQLELGGRSQATGAYQGPMVEWLGDRGWCLGGTTVVERKSRRMVWNLELPLGERLTARKTLAGGWLAAVGSRSNYRLQFSPIPWNQISASLAAMQGDGKAHLKPGTKISLNIQTSDLRFGSADDTVKRLTEVFRRRFKPDGIEIAANQPLVLNVRYRETAGQTLHEQKRFSRESTGRTVEATKVHMKMDFTRRGESEPLWSHEFEHDPQFLAIKGDLNDAAARDSMFSHLLYSLASEPIPYFIPEDSELTQLPGRTKLED